MLSADDLQALGLTIQLAAVSTFVLLLIGTPLAWWLARTNSRLRPVVDTFVALPLVLPPTVLGFYLLLVLGANGPLAPVFSALGLEPLAFTFTGLVVGSVLYSLPFVVQPVRDAFVQIGDRPLEVAETLGASRWTAFSRVALPLARPGLLTGAILGFAHTLGEFGVVLMIGGNIPGETRVASIAIYDHVESLDYGSANAVSLVLLALSFVLLFTVYGLKRRIRVVPA